MIHYDKNDVFYQQEFVYTLQFVTNVDIHLQFCNHENKCKFLYNTEQLYIPKWFNYVSSCSSVIVDYSEENIKLLKNKECLFLPILFHNHLLLEPQVKKFHVCFIGTPTPRRVKILNILTSIGIHIHNINNDFELFSKNKKILRFHILLNIHADDDYKIMEYSRCSIPVFNSQIVVSEKVLDTYTEIKTINDYVLSKIIFVEYDELITKVLEVLQNVDDYTYSSDINLMSELSQKHIQEFNSKVSN